MERRVAAVGGVALAAVAGAMAVGAWLASPPPESAPPLQVRPAAATPSVDEVRERISALEARLERAPEDLAGWKMLGRSYTAQGRYMEAVGAYSRAAQIDPRDPEVAGALKQLETIARERGRHDETVKTR